MEKKEKKMILEMTRKENSGTQAAFLMLGFQLLGSLVMFFYQLHGIEGRELLRNM